MAKTKATARIKNAAALMRVASAMLDGLKPNCQDLFAVQEATAQLLIENNCLPAQSPMRQAKKVSVKK